MRIVVDANIIISALLGSRYVHKLLFDSTLQCFSPIFLLAEIQKHERLIARKAKLHIAEVQDAMEAILTLLELVPKTIELI